MDMAASNYDAAATSDDGTCTYWTLTAADDVDAVWVESAWDPIIPNLNAGEMCDAILSAMTKTDERDQVVDFTRAYYTSSQGVIGGTGAAAITSVSALNASGTTIGLQSGTTSDLYANANLADATISAYEDFPSVITALNNGDVMYALGDSPVLALEGTLLTTFSDENFGLAVREDSGQLLDALNVAIGAMIDSGQYDTIYTAWFDETAVLSDDTTADTATSYPTPAEGSTLTSVLESGSLNICTDPFYPPFEAYAQDGTTVVGFDADIGAAIADEIAAHYMTVNKDSYTPPAEGCMDDTANNYDSSAVKDDGSCTFNEGCMDDTANNYDATAVVDDGSCDHSMMIGFLNPITGPIANFAPGFTFAAAEAIADLNAAGGDFSLVEVDSGCDGSVAGAAAQTLVDAGVVAVAGAACSGATIGANAVLSAAGIPMVSYASTSPALSDASAYPSFYRVVPSDAIQGQAMEAMVSASGVTNPALVHMTNAYGAGLADSFAGYWADAGNTLCNQIGYDDTTITDASSLVQTVSDDGCDSVVLIAYNTDAALILETMAYAGLVLPTFGADGFAGAAALDSFNAPQIINGVQNTLPRSGSSTGDFPDRCATDAGCAAGIFTSEAYDAVMMIGAAANMEAGANMASHLDMVGVGYAGASGSHTFLPNGDVAGTGYDVCTFHHIPTYGQYFNCDRMWTATGGLEDTPWTGATIKIGYLNPITGPIAVYAPGFTASAMIGLQLANTLAYNQGVQFEIVFADSGCDGTVAAAGAQTLIDSGVIGVVGAACSGATMGANAVLSAAGVPMISYASTSPALSDSAAYPDFFRVVPSDALQGQGVNAVVAAHGTDGGDSVALIHMTNAYGAGLADSFKGAYTADGSTLCAEIGYDDTATTDFASVTQAVSDNGCTTVVMVSYATDGAAIIEQLASDGFAGQIIGTDGIAEEGIATEMTDQSLLNGIIATKPASSSSNEVSDTFAYLCSLSTECAGGIFTAESFDAVTIMAFAAFTMMANPGITMSQAIAGTGAGWVGASGTTDFLANGDVAGAGYCVGTFTADATTVSYDCTEHWDPANGLTTV
jgi:branched-chain amino acid transport system substrate-binding protein